MCEGVPAATANPHSPIYKKGLLGCLGGHVTCRTVCRLNTGSAYREPEECAAISSATQAHCPIQCTAQTIDGWLRGLCQRPLKYKHRAPFSNEQERSTAAAQSLSQPAAGTNQQHGQQTSAAAKRASC